MTEEEAEELLRRFREALNGARMAASLTLNDMANFIGIERAALGKIERGVIFPVGKTIHSIWNAVGAELMKRDPGLSLDVLMRAFKVARGRNLARVQKRANLGAAMKAARHEFAIRLREIRCSQCLTQLEVASLMGLGTGVYHRWELEHCVPSLLMFELLCRTLDIDKNDPIRGYWEKASVQPEARYKYLSNGSASPTPPVSAQVTEAKEASGASVKPKDSSDNAICVSLARVLARMKKDGIAAKTPTIVQAHVSRYSCYVVAEQFNKKNGRDYLEIPWMLPKSSMIPSPTYVWVQDGMLRYAPDLFEFDWDGYLSRHDLSVRVVVDVEDEDSDFFEEVDK